MRRLVGLTIVVSFVSGCSQLLGISDPTPGDGGAGSDGDGPAIDAPPPCVTAATFMPEQSFPIGGIGKALAVAQLDRMPGRDVAIAVGDAIQIMSGNGSGSFSSGMRIAVQADGLVLGDFDNDAADSDLVVWDEGGTFIAAIRQDSTVVPSTFLSPQPLTGPFTGLQGALVGLIDGASVPDLVVKDGVEARAYTSRPGTPGTFAREANAIGGIGASDLLVAVGRFNGVGNDDAAFVSAAGEVKIAFDGPQFSPAAVVATGVQDRSIGFGKLDEDGEVDLIVGTAAGGVIYRGGGGTFSQLPGIIPAVVGPSMQVIDLNGDDRDDLVLANRIVYQCAPATAGGPGVFTQVEAIDLGGTVLFADVTGDGKPDLLRLVGTELKVSVQ